MTHVLPVLSGLVTAFLLAVGLTGGLRYYALSRQRLMDTPNNRSAHATPTPRGGGLAFVLVFLGGLPLLAAWGGLDWRQAGALSASAAAVALVGFLDDLSPVTAGWRLLVHGLAALFLLLGLGGLPGSLGPAAPWLLPVAALALVWLLNLYNFMDGIDGIAGVQALCATSGAALLYLLAGAPAALQFPPLLLAAATAGFLVWNLPPARIFMGDVGSGFLGFVLGGLALLAIWQDPLWFWVWCTLLGVFVVDASTTLLVRLFRGESVLQAHCSHAYQHAARHWGHGRVTTAVALINLLWLWPLAAATVLASLPGLLMLLLAWLPLLCLVVVLGAGRPERRPNIAG